MVTIPRKQISGALTTTPGVAKKDPGVESISGRVTAEIGESLMQVTQQFKEAKALEESTRAKTMVMQSERELQLEAEQGDEIWDIQKFRERRKEITSKAGEGISNHTARKQFLIEDEQESVLSDFNIRKTLRDRQQSWFKVIMFEQVDTLGELHAGVGSFGRKTSAQISAERKLYEDKRDALIEENIKRNVIDREAAYKYEEKLDKAWLETSLRSDIVKDPEKAIIRIEQGEYPIPPGETNEWLALADRTKKNNKKTVKDDLEEMWRNGYAETLGKLEEFSVEDIISSVTLGNMNPKDGYDLVKWKTNHEKSSPWNQYETDKDIWTELAIDSKNLDLDLEKFIEKVKKAFVDEQIDQKEAQGFILATQKLYENAVKHKARQDRFAWLQGVKMDMMKGALRGMPDPKAATFHAIKELMNGVDKGEITEGNIDEASQKIIKEEIVSQNPQVGLLDDVPNAIVSENEELSTVFDGKTGTKADYEWRDGKLIKV